MPANRDVIVVGAGHNGLVTAFYLGRAGLSVEVVEAQDAIGGACKTEELINGYRFSTCANVLAWMRPKVLADMGLIERGLEVRGGFPRSRIIDRDRGFTHWADRGELKSEIRRFSRADSEAFDDWAALWSAATDLLGPYLLSYPPSLVELQRRAERLGHADLLATLLTSSLGELADRYFESPEIRGGIEAPHDVGSLYDHGSAFLRGLGEAVRTYTETGEPSPRGFVHGGMGRLTELMAEAAESESVVIRTGTPVKRIVVEDGRAVGVELEDGTQLQAPTVVSGADIKRTFGRLLAGVVELSQLAPRVAQLRADIAPLKLHLALSELPTFQPFPDCNILHRGSVGIQPDRSYHERAWDDARHGRLPRSPYMLMMVPSVWDDTLAPPGHHTMSIWMQYAPVRLAESSWAEQSGVMAERIIDTISTYSAGFRDKIVDRLLLTPADLDDRVLLTDGNIHHVDIVPSQMLWQRPCPELARYRTPVDGLYLCGAGQHPYGEITGAPGHNAAHAVLEDLELVTSQWQEIRHE